MKFAAALLASTAAALSTTSKYMQYINTHGKSYLTKEEFKAREALFAISDEFVESHNQTNANFTVGHNKFSDMNEAEKASYRGRIPKAAKTGETVSFSNVSTPESVDWRGTCVNAIRDQGQCGSCWAFSSVASMEGAHCVATGELLELSE
jgi:cathepsin L